MTELKCQNCRETFALPAGSARQLLNFCPYCGSTGIAIVVKEGPVLQSPTAPLASDIEPEDLVEEEEKPRRSRKR